MKISDLADDGDEDGLAKHLEFIWHSVKPAETRKIQVKIVTD